MNDSLTVRLSHSRSRLQRRRWLSGLIWNGLTLCLLLLVLGGVNALFPLQERQAFVLFLPVFFLFVVRLLWDTYRSFLSPPALPELAAEVEKRNPRWMDALICAVEREERPSGSLLEIERALIDKMRRDTRTVDFTALLMPRRWRPAVLAAGAAGLLLLLWPATTNPYSQKALAYFSDVLGGESTGLAVTPGDEAVPVNTDLTVRAEVRRWENEARVEYMDARGRHDFPMHADSGDAHRFTFYGVDEEIRYRVVTPALTSPWYRVAPYVPPSIEGIRVTVTPPAYSGEDPRTFRSITDFTLLEGSRVRWELDLPEGVRASLAPEGEEAPPAVAEDGGAAFEKRVDSDLHARFHLESAEGRTARSAAFRITARPDYPPTLDVTRPGQDIDAEPGDRVGIEAAAADDFGLREVAIRYSVSGVRQEGKVLYEAGADLASTELSREEIVAYTLDLEELGAEEGDIVTYFLTAVDNREPDPQTTRSEVFFVEVREQREPEEMEGDPMDQEEIDIRALLVESKRLIRLSWETLAAEGQRRETLTEELALSMEALRIETTGIEQEIIDLAGGDESHLVIQLMRDAINRMSSAGRLIQADQVEDSIPYQEQALARLLAVENELARDPMRSEEPSEEDGSGGEAGEADQPDEDAMEQMLADLRRLSEEIRDLTDGQTGQNQSVGRLAGTGAGAEERNELRERQQSLHAEARRIRRELTNLPGTAGVWREMDAAAGFMDQAGRETAADRLDRAEREGERARAALLAAGDELNDLLERATSSEVDRLSQWAEALSEQHGAAAAASRELAAEESPDSGELAAQRDRQEGMRDSYEDLLAAMDQQAVDLMDEHPEVAEALFELGRNLRDEQLAGDMDRAANALLYQLPDRAAGIQEELADRLNRFSQELRDAGEGMPAFSREQLVQALEQLRQARQEISEMFGQASEEAGERMRELSREIGEGLAEIGEGLDDQTLREISGSLLGAEGAGAQRPNPLRLESMLSAAGRSLEQRILAMEVERQIRLSRRGGEPPERYRGLVEQYFRNLSESP